ncbi:D-2-hydroxyacid dehydrogenase [Paenibacillus sp. GCM10023252]|uniref:D-2-hydroxyacid dehydrogenase n=1 Tax=Paenibacillus sp. GCM10023252 TaxID=3252649 RepID=UPI00361ADC95
MRIVVLDGLTANPGDLTWKAFEEMGELQVYERTSPSEVAERARGATMILTNKTPLPAEIIAQLPELKYIGVLATGYNVVDTKGAAERGIVVTNVPDYSTMSVVQLVFAFLLEHCHHVQRHADEVADGAWESCADFSFTSFPLMELAGKTFGIVGYGQIGQAVARAALVFGMKVAVHTRTVKTIPGLEAVQFVSLDELLSCSDVLSLHCPLTPETLGIINKTNLARMKPSAFLINTARGGHVVEADLADALNHGIIAGAGLDVLNAEPPAPGHPLIRASNTFITPHIGWATKEARARLLQVAVTNLKSYLSGRIVNRVN